MLYFRIFGIPVTVQPWFWLTMGLIGAGNLNDRYDLLRLALFMIAGFISILVHELGHALTIRKFGAKTEIVLQAFGGYATLPRNRFSRTQDFLITAAGPAIQIALGFIALYLLGAIHYPNEISKGFVYSLRWVSFAWAILNLFPIYPLDGGQMLNAVLGPRRRKATHITGLITACGLALLGLKIGFIFPALFMGMLAHQNYQLLKQS